VGSYGSAGKSEPSLRSARQPTRIDIRADPRIDLKVGRYKRKEKPENGRPRKAARTEPPQEGNLRFVLIVTAGDFAHDGSHEVLGIAEQH